MGTIAATRSIVTEADTSSPTYELVILQVYFGELITWLDLTAIHASLSVKTSEGLAST